MYSPVHISDTFLLVVGNFFDDLFIIPGLSENNHLLIMMGLVVLKVFEILRGFLFGLFFGYILPNEIVYTLANIIPHVLIGLTALFLARLVVGRFFKLLFLVVKWKG